MSRKQAPVVRPSRERANPFNDNQDLITDPVFLIGNGASRRAFELERLREKGTIIGCNALYREFSPDLLIVIDAKMINEVRKAGYKGRSIIAANRSTTIPGSMVWRTERFNTSGCFGMKMITQLIKPSKCYMLGMDGYPGNMYDGTVNYNSNTLQNFTGVINYYLKTLSGEGDTVFYNVNERDEWPPTAHATGKYNFMTYDKFEETVMA